jgi:hypothetical protein
MLDLFGYQLNLIDAFVFIAFLGLAGYIIFFTTFTAFNTDAKSFNEHKKIALVITFIQVFILAIWILWESL